MPRERVLSARINTSRDKVATAGSEERYRLTTSLEARCTRAGNANLNRWKGREPRSPTERERERAAVVGRAARRRLIERATAFVVLA